MFRFVILHRLYRFSFLGSSMTSRGYAKTVIVPNVSTCDPWTGLIIVAQTPYSFDSKGNPHICVRTFGFFHLLAFDALDSRDKSFVFISLSVTRISFLSVYYIYTTDGMTRAVFTGPFHTALHFVLCHITVGRSFILYIISLGLLKRAN